MGLRIARYDGLVVHYILVDPAATVALFEIAEPTTIVTSDYSTRYYIHHFIRPLGEHAQGADIRKQRKFDTIGGQTHDGVCRHVETWI